MPKVRRTDIGGIMTDLWEQTSKDAWQTAKELTRASGRNKNGGSVYSSAMRSLTLTGAVEFRQVQHINKNGHPQGRPRKEYRRVKDMFYNTRQDARYQYWQWDQLTDADKREADERYASQYPWLSVTDWLYPMTKGSKYGSRPRIGMGGTRVLNITEEEAERKRQAWREGESGWLMERDGSGRAAK